MTRTTASALTPSAYEDGFARANLPPLDEWPEFLFELPELQYPDRLNSAGVLLDGALARGWGERTALTGLQASWTYSELHARADRIAHVLRTDLGLVTGNRVLLRGANCPMMAACILAVIKAGCIAVPTMPLLRARELATIIDKAQVNAVLCAASLRDEIDAVLEARSESAVVPAFDVVPAQGSAPPRGTPVPMLTFDAPDTPGSLESLMSRYAAPFATVPTSADDVCLISFTSGTTGIPKGTLHFHRDVLAICDCFPRSMLGATADDVFIGTPPLAFTFGLGGLLLFPLRVGASAVLLEKLTPETLLAAIEQHRATVCFTAPTFYRQMTPLAPRFDIGSLSRSVSAGEALPLATRESWQAATGLSMIDGIGATEMLHIFISAVGDEVRPGATGKPIPGYRACVLDAQGNPAGPGVIGRLAVKGPTGCRYLADARQREYVANGWNLTGDAYEMDADGYFFYRSRTDDMIISAGYNIAGAEVEEALLRHPDVAECGVVGRADEERGQVVEAHVVLKPGVEPGAATASTLQDFVKQQIAPYKYPRVVHFVERLPRTETGKLQRFKLRTQAPG
jgi:2-aminobenzoate-CoA ligase